MLGIHFYIRKHSNKYNKGGCKDVWSIRRHNDHSRVNGRPARPNKVFIWIIGFQRIKWISDRAAMEDTQGKRRGIHPKEIRPWLAKKTPFFENSLANPLAQKKPTQKGRWNFNVLRFCGGDDGNRTHVRKHFRKIFSERSFCFKDSPQITPKSRLYPRLSRYSLMLPGIHIRFSCMIDARHPAYR